MELLTGILDESVFAEIDANSNGILTADELDSWTHQEAKKYFQKADRDSSGGLSHEELAAILDEVLDLHYGANPDL